MREITTTLAASLFVCVAWLPGQDYETERAAAIKDLVPKLEKLASWAQKNKLMGERDRTLAGILEWDPDHKRARRTLKYRKQRDGSWKQARSYRAPKNRSDKKMPDFEAKRQEAIDPFCERIVGLLDKHKSSLTETERKSALEGLIAVQPDHVAVREALGYRRVDGEWLTKREIASRKRKEKIARARADAFSKVKKLEELIPDGDVKTCGVPWKVILKTSGVKIYSVYPRKEAERIIRACQAARDYMKANVGNAVVHPVDFRIYLVRSVKHARKAITGLSAFGVDLLDHAQYSSFWSRTHNHLMIRHDTREMRLDYCVRQTISWLVTRTYGIGHEKGWMYEGLSLHLTRGLTGSAMTWFGGRGADGTPSEMEARFGVPNLDWRKEAKDVLTRNAVQLASLMGKKLNEMSGEEVVVAALFCQWLIEERGREARRLFSKSAKEGPEGAVKYAFADSVANVEKQFAEWLFR